MAGRILKAAQEPTSSESLSWMQATKVLPMLAPSALDAVKQWIYQPYILDGSPTEVNTTITVNYNLNPS